MSPHVQVTVRAGWAGCHLMRCSALMTFCSQGRASSAQVTHNLQRSQDFLGKIQSCAFSRRLSPASVLNSRKYLMEGRCCSTRRASGPGGWAWTARPPWGRSGGQCWRPWRGWRRRGRVTYHHMGRRWRGNSLISFSWNNLFDSVISAVARNHFSRLK